MKQALILIVSLLLIGCKKETSTPLNELKGKTVNISSAQGFSLINYQDYQLLEVTKAFPNSTDTLRYALIRKDLNASKRAELESSFGSNLIQIPIKTAVVTSTTHIPSLEMLEVSESLVGFPNLDYISSPLSRKRIAKNAIKELGQNESINTEVLIDLDPDVVVSFGVEGQNKSLALAKEAGIPILYNGDWVEQDPLGKAEWIKFFGALYDKNELAQTLFDNIKEEYNATKALVDKTTNKPTVISGAMYKDVWYLPKGESWPARIINDAGGNYLWAETEGAGSLSLSIESVLDKGQNASFWIAPAQYSSYEAMKKANNAYAQFQAFKNKKVFTFASKKGETGGLLYYELAPNRPDIVLKDIVHYLHPELLPEYQPYFFTPLEE